MTSMFTRYRQQLFRPGRECRLLRFSPAPGPEGPKPINVKDIKDKLKNVEETKVPESPASAEQLKTLREQKIQEAGSNAARLEQNLRSGLEKAATTYLRALMEPPHNKTVADALMQAKTNFREVAQLEQGRDEGGKPTVRVTKLETRESMESLATQRLNAVLEKNGVDAATAEKIRAAVQRVPAVTQEAAIGVLEEYGPIGVVAANDIAQFFENISNNGARIEQQVSVIVRTKKGGNVNALTEADLTFLPEGQRRICFLLLKKVPQVQQQQKQERTEASKEKDMKDAQAMLDEYNSGSEKTDEAKNLARAKAMMYFGVDVKVEGGRLVASPPAKEEQRTINHVMGFITYIVLTIASLKKQFNELTGQGKAKAEGGAEVKNETSQQKNRREGLAYLGSKGGKAQGDSAMTFNADVGGERGPSKDGKVTVTFEHSDTAGWQWKDNHDNALFSVGGGKYPNEASLNEAQKNTRETLNSYAKELAKLNDQAKTAADKGKTETQEKDKENTKKAINEFNDKNPATVAKILEKDGKAEKIIFEPQSGYSIDFLQEKAMHAGLQGGAISDGKFEAPATPENLQKLAAYKTKLAEKTKETREQFEKRHLRTFADILQSKGATIALQESDSTEQMAQKICEGIRNAKSALSLDLESDGDLCENDDDAFGMLSVDDEIIDDFESRIRTDPIGVIETFANEKWKAGAKKMDGWSVNSKNTIPAIAKSLRNAIGAVKNQYETA